MPHKSKNRHERLVKSIEVYANDVKVSWTSGRGSKRRREESRGKIDKLSEESLRRLAFVASNTAIEFTAMITLTYPAEFPGTGKTVKTHLNRFLAWLRSRGIKSYLWFLEFQRRGAPHVHLLIDGWIDKDAVARRWYAAVGSGDEKHLRAGTRTERIRERRGGAHYAVKYAAKAEQKRVPAGFRDVGRFWGHSRDVRPEPIGRLETDGYMTPDELIEILGSWSWKYKLREVPLSTLYNASVPLAEAAVRRTLDKHAIIVSD
jgi:hypothetical protein